ncbi:MAG: fatty-acyl-CoA synthase, partial [Planctomycetota bacterium]
MDHEFRGERSQVCVSMDRKQARSRFKIARICPTRTRPESDGCRLARSEHGHPSYAFLRNMGRGATKPLMDRDPNAGELDQPQTLIEMLVQAAEQRPDRGITLRDSRGRVSERRSWPELMQNVQVAAGKLAAAGVPRRAPVLLTLPTSFELIDLWIACLWHGALPIVSAPPVGMGAGLRELEKVAHVMKQTGADRCIGPGSVRTAALEAGFDELATKLATTESILGLEAPVMSEPYAARPDELAFLQLTSGSTGKPRAVMITHAAAVANSCANDFAIGQPLGKRAAELYDAMVSWLPLHHDMGLVGGVLFCMYCGIDLELFSTRSFLARPELWLAELGKVSRGGRTLAPAPNFAYQTCVERVTPEQLGQTDLSLWGSALIGAEMVRPETVAAMIERFSGNGFNPKAVRSCYGLAEGTLSVSFDVRGEGLRTRPAPLGLSAEIGGGLVGAEVASSGVAVRETRILVTRTDGTPVQDGEVGEVRAKGPGIFSGYFNDPEASAELLVDGWLRTGDLGFLHDDELYITGRSKELLILRGHNMMPHELEWHADAATGGGGTSRSGAFSIAQSGQGEQAVLVVETSEKDAGVLAAIEREIRVKLGRELGLTLADFCFVRRGRIPKTTSGKVRRGELRR